MPKPTMHDVAKCAHVSVATVSHVINNTRFVSDEIRHKVLSCVEALGYRPDAMARMLKTGRTNLIGYVIPDISSTYQVTLVEQIEEVVVAEDYRLIVVNTHETKKREIEHIHALTSGMVDGLIIASTMERYDELKGLIPPNLPTVFIDRTMPGCPYDTVSISCYDAVYQGVETLIREGHKKIGYITGLIRLSNFHERFDAFKDALRDNGIPLDDTLIRYVDAMRKNTVARVMELIQAGCTALIVPHTIVTDDVHFYFFEQNTKHSHGISILAFSDIDKPDYYVRQIHTVRHPIQALGRKAGEMILSRISNPNTPIQNVVLKSSFFPATESP